MNETLGPVLDRFYAAASHFMAYVDSASTLERDVFLSLIGRSLAALYSSALEIPLVGPASDSANESPFSKEEWSKQYEFLREKIGEFDSYWAVFDMTEKEEPVQGSLAGDISEIYSDLGEHLQFRKTNVASADLLFDIYLSFRDHWGRHALHALQALYDLRL